MDHCGTSRETHRTLAAALGYKSRTRPYPFIIAHECDEKYFDRETKDYKTRTRNFYAFDSIDDFLQDRGNYPHAHEVTFNRYAEHQQGRLVFDFDFEEPWFGLKPKFVCPTFERDIETLVKDTFERFYIDVDASRFVFVWLVSDIEEKWSKHLIVKNAHFADNWKLQSKIFYQLMLGLVAERGMFPTIKTDDLIDLQVARSNATMRMCGSSKMKNLKVLRLELPSDATFFDTLIQLYRREDIRVEQNIYLEQINRSTLDRIMSSASLVGAMPNERISKSHFIEACLLCDIDMTKHNDFSNENITDAEARLAFEAFELYYKHAHGTSVTGFVVKNVIGTLINLERRIPTKCLISGKVHDNENAYLSVFADKSVHFHCRRGCQFKGKKGICIRLRPK